MYPHIHKLVSVGSQSIGAPLLSDSAVILDAWGHLGEQVVTMLGKKNGFYAFESALHIFPVAQGSQLPGGDIERWNAVSSWKESYGQLITQRLLCFAEDIFGDQFCLSDAGVVRFDAETGSVEPISDDVECWAKKILDDYPRVTGYPLAHAWQIANGPLAVAKRLVPKQPFVIGGEYTLANLFAMDAIASMRLRGEIALQLAELPDGTEVEIEYC